MKYYIEVGTVNKAKQDIDEICRQDGFVNLTRRNFGKGGVGRFMTKLVSVTSILWRLKQGDTLFLQYPMKKFYYIACSLAHLRGARVVTVIHDLGAFRRHKLTPRQENKLLSKTDFLIVHNPTMRDYLLEHGYKGGIHCLQIFDYLSSSEPKPYVTPHTPWRVVYAGNLARWRNAFLYTLQPVMDSWQLDMYGKGFADGQQSDNNPTTALKYHGFIASDDFIAQAQADFGLVWDGDSIDRCTGDWGDYLRINNPHKTSFYLRAGIPVIVWAEAAMAPFVRQHNIGIVVNSLSQISSRIAELSPADYSSIRENALAVGRRHAEGYYIREALKAAHI